MIFSYCVGVELRARSAVRVPRWMVEDTKGLVVARVTHLSIKMEPHSSTSSFSNVILSLAMLYVVLMVTSAANAHPLTCPCH